MVTTRLQAKTKPKRVRFADETSVTGEEDATQREEANGVPTEDSVRLEAELSRVTAPDGTTPASPDAEDVDPPNGPKRTSKKDRDCSGRGVTVGEFEDSSLRRRINPNLKQKPTEDPWILSGEHTTLNDDSRSTTELPRLIRRRPPRDFFAGKNQP
ncbi:hypothetical protein PHMEG_00024712 [Phytophthora megakarya]|uniref:Uncharacterized protein n=1 Tax=Phytophthora megakarya TaxID=4795 RepID=A0A225VGC0_9STRA|nr:hypothetical protein PHMEG_00024712 [Phytophthora megakarya]